MSEFDIDRLPVEQPLAYETDTVKEDMCRIFREHFPVVVTKIEETEFNTLTTFYSDGSVKYRKLR